jgi:hypothetical protein
MNTTGRRRPWGVEKINLCLERMAWRSCGTEGVYVACMARSWEITPE